MTDQQKALAKIKIQQVVYEVQYCNTQPASSYYPPSENSLY